MTQIELKRAIFEYDIAKSEIQKTNIFGYDIALHWFNTQCNNTGQKKETDKLGVAYQTVFINEIVKDFLENERPIPATLNKLKKWFDELIIIENDTIDWEGFFVSNTDNLIDILRTHYKTMPDKIYWKMVSKCYTISNLAHTDMAIILNYLNDERPEKEYLMNDEEREFFNKLPDEVTIYRGCTKKEIKSGNFRISWTLDKMVAEFFAFEYINLTRENSLNKDQSLYDVVKKTVSKKDLLCYFGGREEAEVLYIPSN